MSNEAGLTLEDRRKRYRWLYKDPRLPRTWQSRRNADSCWWRKRRRSTRRRSRWPVTVSLPLIVEFVEVLTSWTTSGAHTSPVLQDGMVGRASLPVTVQVSKSGEVAI